MRACDNPFASHHIENLPFVFPAGDSWAELLARLERVRWRGSITGLHGTGKTTLLEQLAARLGGRGFVPRLLTLRAESSRADKQTIIAAVRAMRAPDFLLLDGAEQLGALDWLRLRWASRRCAGCVITLHARGRLPAVFETRPSAELLGDLIARLGGGPEALADARAMMERHGDNLRECLRELYDRAS